MFACTNVTSIRIAGSLLFAISFLLTSCGGLSPTAMVPDIEGNHHTHINKSVRIVEVTGGTEPEFGGPQTVTNEKLRETITSTLRQANLFRAIRTDSECNNGECDLDLKATIVSQGPAKHASGIEFRWELIATYEFSERISGMVVWRDTYQSEFGSTALAGAVRAARAIEGSVRENLALLVQGIDERWPTTAK